MDDILSRLETNTGIYEYVKLEVEEVDHSHFHFLPYEMCPACGDIGQNIINPKDKPKTWIFYCHYCHTHYRVQFTDKGLPIQRR